MSSRRAVLSVVLGLLLLPASASATPGWTAPTNFPLPANALPSTVHIAYQSGGTATIAYLELVSITPLQTALHVGVVPPGGAYQEQLRIASETNSIPADVKFAEAPDGAAVVQWSVLQGSEPTTSPLAYRASYRPAGSGTWEAPATIAADATQVKGIADTLVPTISTDGTAAAGVDHLDPTIPPPGGYRIDVAVHPPGGSWGPPAQISPAKDSSEGLALGFDANGDLTAAFRLELSNTRHTLAAERRPASSGVWGSLEDVTGSDVTSDVFGPALGVSPDGSAVIAFQYVHYAGSKTLDVNAVTRSGANGPWTEAVDVASGGASSGPMAAGVSPDDKAYVLYSFQGTSSGQDCVGLVRGWPGNVFSGPQCVSATNFQSGYAGGLAFLGNDAYAAWSGQPNGGSSYVAEGSRWIDGASQPDSFTDLDTPSTSISLKQVVPDEDGSVAAFWATPSTLRAAAFDAGGPNLLSAGVPATAIAGQPVSFSASFFDLWAGLGAGQPTWSFGDGTALLAGANVTHTFSAPGAYTISLGAADALGNAAGTTTYTITVQSPPSSGPVVDTQPPKVTLNIPKCPKKLSKKACKRRLQSRSAWQTLTGQVTDPAPSSGIASVQVAVYLTRGKHIEGLAGKRFRKTTIAKARKTFTAAGVSGASWSLRLPKLGPGRYTILLRATDRAGHLSATVTKTLQLK